MDKTQKEKIIVLFLLVIVAIMIANKMLFKKDRKDVPANIDEISSETLNEIGKIDRVLSNKDEFVTYYGDSYRDPTFLPQWFERKEEIEIVPEEPEEVVEEEIQLPVLDINGIVWSGTEGYLLMDDKIFKKGEHAENGIEILEIKRNEITLLYKNKQFVVSVD